MMWSHIERVTFIRRLNTHLPGFAELKKDPGKDGETADSASVPHQVWDSITVSVLRNTEVFNFHLPNSL